MRGRRDVFIGVDVGTRGVRVVAIDETGELAAISRQPFAPAENDEEQSPAEWWEKTLLALREVASELARDRGAVPVALSVTATSGTVIPLDAAFEPLHDALMYRETRAVAETAFINQIAPDMGANLSWGLPKMRWFGERFPGARVHAWRHAGDWLLGRLTGIWDATDVTSALKSGYDPVAERWPDIITGAIGIPAESLPRVLPSGVVLGGLRPDVAESTGLPASLLVTTGMTDGCASQVASGAARPGDWNTTIGTTMVVKGVTRERLVDPRGRLYNHRHPDGWWMPGGASNTGADWIARDYPEHDIPCLESRAAALTPTGLAAYPLRQAGERFPFLSTGARGFDPTEVDEATLFAARLEGVAYLERLSFDLIERLSGEPVARVFSAGGGSRGDLWTRIRSDVMNRPILRAAHPEGAAGAAIVAAAGVRYGSLARAAADLTRIVSTTEPGPNAARYDDGYQRFCAALRERGYRDEDESG